MLYPKMISNLILFLLTISIIVYPQAGVSTITVYAHPVPTEIKQQQNQLFSYESVLTLIEKIEEGFLEEKCNLEDLDKINHLLANLAEQGILPDELDEAFALESDIQELLHPEQRLYEYASWQSSGFYGQGKILLCKSWFHKKWDQTKKFIKKHKKAILIGAAIVAGAAIVVGVIIATSSAGVAAAGAAGAAGVLGAREGNDKNVSGNEPSSSINIPEIAEITDSPMLREAFHEEASIFKEWIANDQFLNTELSGFPLEESGRILRDAFAYQNLESFNEHSFQEFSGSSSLIDEPIDVYQLRGERALELHYYDQAISDLGKAIELNPDSCEAYLSRATAHLKMGEPERSLEDYLQYRAKQSTVLERAAEFSLGFLDFNSGFEQGLSKGIKESGLQLGAFVKQCGTHPVDTTKEIYAAFGNLCGLVKSQQWGTIGEIFLPEVCELVTKWDTLSFEEQGKGIGYTLGKVGADILIPGTVAKAASTGLKGAKEFVTACKTLKKAEKTLVLEALAQSATTAEGLAEAASQLRRAESVVHSSTLPLFRNAEGVLIAHVGPEFIQHFKNAEAFLKPYSKTFLPENQVRELIHQTGIRTLPRPQGIPENFRIKVADKGAGMKYVHPTNEQTYVRVMPGKPHSPNQGQQKPYVVHMKDGKTFDKSGNIISGSSTEAHIPIEEFIYRD
ncbi:MAG: hypothetical protein V4494_02930 [Chlamydiota bacterium]